MGLNIYLCKNTEGGGTRVNEGVRDPRFPDHVCDLGYLRSSYNEAGYNTVAEDRGWPTFYDIFTPNPDYDVVVPDWKKALERVNQALERITPDDSRYFVVELWDLPIAGLPTSSRKEAIERVIDERNRLKRRSGSGAFENAYGSFHLSESLRVVAALRARPEGLLSAHTYLVCERGEGEDYYLSTLLITKALIEYVLAQPDKEAHYLDWSA